MIIGDGDVASVLPDRDDLLFFASGVSDSVNATEEDYEQEIELLMNQPKDAHIVYFSSLGVFSAMTRYMVHKSVIEEYIKGTFPSYCIVRLGNITWGTNPNTLINYLKAHPDAEIRDEWRYICSKDEFLYWINLIPSWSCDMNIPGKRLKVKQIKEALDGH